MKHENAIYIKGARVHNLRNIEVEIPHDKLVVITGLSGSGKSTLAFDTIFAEGQRRYVESLSAYARQFLGKINKPDVDIITGIAPAIAIEQKVNTRNPRSTVGTTTEIYDYLKLLYARIGHTFSPVSGEEVRCFSVDDVAAWILAHADQRVVIGAPLALAEGQGIIEKLTLLLSEGLMRVYMDGEVRLIEEVLPGIGPDTKADDIRIVVDRMRVATDEDSQTRIRDSVARAFSYGDGICEIVTDEGVREFSSRFEADGIEFEQPSEHLFSFNNPLGACPRCEGYGKVIGIDEDLVIPDKSKTIYEDAVACWRGETMRKWKQKLVENAYKFDFPIHTPFHELTQEQKRLLWRGNDYFHGLDDFFAYIDSERRKIQFRVMKARYTGKTTCPECGGSRLRKEAQYVRVGGKTIADLEAVTPAQALAHPTWNMGAKISIDSSTLMNKGLEVIEAHHLFAMPYDQIEVVVQPQSAIHSMVEFTDGSVLAHLGTTDMRIPIQFALSYPERWEAPVRPLDFRTLGSLEFAAPDVDTFRCLSLARHAGEVGGTLPAVMNAANEVAVAAFLAEQIGYLDIARCVEATMDAHEGAGVQVVESLEQLKAVDAWARAFASEWARGRRS